MRMMRVSKSILCLLAGFTVSSVAVAQTGAASGTRYGSGQDSVRCLQNLSLFGSYVKAGSINDAIEPWRAAYKECPTSSKNIYIHGATILKHLINSEKDATKRLALAEELIQLYDDRIKHFGDDARHGQDVITNNKIADYIAIYGEKADYGKIYEWAKTAIDQAQENSVPQLFNYFTYASQVLARKDTTLIQTYIDDYLKTSDLLDKQVAAAEGNEKLLAAAEANKQAVDNAFAGSGLASCEILQKVYTSAKIEENKDNKAFLEKTCNLFLGAGCDTPVYFQAAKYLFNIEPSAKAAMGLAGQAIQEKRYGEAQEYLQKAIQYATNNSDKVKCYEVMSNLAMAQGNYGAARSAASSALQLNPRSGKSLMVMAQLIARSAESLFPNDRVKQQAVYYLVIDRLSAAASADPSVAGQANSLIGRYRAYLPKAADIFMHPELKKGSSFNVPGYGTTTIR